MKNGLYISQLGTKYWFKNDEQHREDGPAIEYADGQKEWYINDSLHREDGPAVEYPDGSYVWFYYDKRHRLNGPAVVGIPYGVKNWWVDGVPLDDHPLSKWLKKRKWYSKFKRGDLTEEQILEIRMVFGF